VERRGPKRRGLIGVESSGKGSTDLIQCPATRDVEALSFRRWFDSTVGSRAMIQGWGGERACVAFNP
jgi:hypothetical protein